MPTPGNEHDRRIGAAHRGRLRRRVRLVVAAVVVPVLGVKLAQPCGLLLDRGVGGQVEEQRPHLRAEKVVGAGGAERREPRRRLGGEEVEHDVGVGEPSDDVPVRGGETAHHGRERRRALPPLRVRQTAVARLAATRTGSGRPCSAR